MEVGFCYKTADIWQIVGYGFRVLTIVVPLIIIILGSITLAKAVISSDEKEIKTAAVSLLKRLITGLAIFFVPTVIAFIFSLINGFDEEMQNDYGICFKCITNANECDTSYEEEIFNTD